MEVVREQRKQRAAKNSSLAERLLDIHRTTHAFLGRAVLRIL
jgi:hypothetical protein